MDYKFCPICAGRLVETNEGDMKDVPVCQHCGFQFFQNSKPTAVAIFANQDDKILLVKRSHEPSKGKWGLVGGFLEIGEELEDGLRREVEEELNCSIKNPRFFASYINHYMHDSKIKNAYTLDLYFLCELDGEPSLSDEVEEINWFAKENIPWKEIAFESNKKALLKYLDIDKE